MVSMKDVTGVSYVVPSQKQVEETSFNNLSDSVVCVSAPAKSRAVPLASGHLKLVEKPQDLKG